MKKFFLPVLIVLTAGLFSQKWFGNRELIPEVIEHSIQKGTSWYSYCSAPAYAVPVDEERAVYINVNDFGVEYPVNLHAVSSYLYSDGVTFGYRIYAKDGTTVLYQNTRLTSTSDYNDHFLSTPLILTDDFWVSVVPNNGGEPYQVISGELSDTHSYTGEAGNWSKFDVDGDLYEHLISFQLSDYEGEDIYPPTVREIKGTSPFMGADAKISLSVQDQNAVISPVTGEYSFDGGASWTSFELNSAKGSYLFTGSIPGQPDETSGILRFILEDDQDNGILIDGYSIIWSRNNPIVNEGFESPYFPPSGWSLSTAGAGWIQGEPSASPLVNSGSCSAAHLDDTGEQDDWLITDNIDVYGVGVTYLSFYQASRWSEYLTFHEVAVSADDGNSWTQLYLDDQPKPNSDVTEEFQQEVISLEDYAGQTVKIGFHYAGNYSDQWFIDDIRVYYDSDGPMLNTVTGNPSLMPVIGSYLDEDFQISLKVFDTSGTESVVGHYTFDSGTTSSDLIFYPDDLIEGSWKGTIPAFSEPVTGTISFTLTDIGGNVTNTENYDIAFMTDSVEPLIRSFYNGIACTGTDMHPVLRFSEGSTIPVCKGFFSNDGFITVYEFDLNPQKGNYHIFTGIIPSSYGSLKTGEVYFRVEDTAGNFTVSETYPVKWIDNYSSVFDLRTSMGKNYVSPVKNQTYGTCWLHTTCACLESNLLRNGNWENEGETGPPDLSETHMSWWLGFNQFFNEDIYPEDGDGLEVHLQADFYISAAYLTRGEGAVRDVDSDEDPGQYLVPPERYSDTYHYYFPRDIEWYSMDGELNGIDLIKEKVMEYGSVAVGLLASSYDHDTYIHYQSPDDPLYVSHGVSVVGWDDDKVTQAPEGPGAWLCKNNWGEYFGFNGFYWVSYYDKHAAKGDIGAVSFHNVEKMKYSSVYYHDYHGYDTTMPEISEAFNAFTVRSGDDGWLTSVNIFNAVHDVDYSVKVYREFDSGVLSNEVANASGHIDFKGHHTIDLSERIYLAEGEKFYVYLSLSDGGQPIDQSSYIETAYLTYESSASPGESYYFEDGEWKDLYYNTTIASPVTANFCIKALFKDSSGISDEHCIINDFELYQNYPNPFNPETVITYAIGHDSFVDLSVYNLKGEKISVLTNGNVTAGNHRVSFNAQNLTSGVYYYRLNINGKTEAVRKMLLVR